MKKCSLLFIAFIALVVQNPDAQQLSPFVVSSAGGFSANNAGMLSFTVGEMSAVETYTTAGNILTQGFQQAWDFNTATHEDPAGGFAFDIYPNPSSGNFQLVSFADRDELISIRIMDIHYHHIAGIHIEPVDLQYLAQGIYLILVHLGGNATHDAYQFTDKINIVR